ncbi:hypothetical protein BHE74_00033374 [Ensete ventricosum]|nr:hypothetical protein BHE74_00033374 [Ensete ventricosum]
MKRAFAGQAQCLETPQPPTVFVAEASATCEPEPPVNKTKVLVSKEALPVFAPRKAIPPEAPRGEGSNKWRDKVVSQAQSKDEPFLTQDGLLEAQWATLTVVDKLSKIIDGLWVEVRKLKDEAGLVAMVTVEAQILEALLQGLGDDLDNTREVESYLTAVRSTLQKAENSLLGLEKMGWISYEYGYKVVLTCYLARYPQLEIEEDPYTTLPEDDNVSMEANVPFDDSDPLVT